MHTLHIQDRILHLPKAAYWSLIQTGSYILAFYSFSYICQTIGIIPYILFPQNYYFYFGPFEFLVGLGVIFITDPRIWIYIIVLFFVLLTYDEVDRRKKKLNIQIHPRFFALLYACGGISFALFTYLLQMYPIVSKILEIS